MKNYAMILLVMYGYASHAQNNAIFNGGAADGVDRRGFAQASTNIFYGGTQDGWNYGAFTQAVNNVFQGGIGDGWNFSAYAQPVNNIYIGGNGDAWSFNNFLQAGNIIFNGGQGDGWASTYRPLGVLPVTFVKFTAEKQQLTSLLQWQTSTEINSASFDVERSGDAIHFSKIGTVAAAGNSTAVKDYRFVDAQPITGTNYYRLKQIDRNGSFVYTPTRMVLFDAAALVSLKVYPVPATTLLTIELPQKLLNANVVLNLSNALGVMVQQLKVNRNTSNRQLMNLSTLPAGVYTLQVSASNYNATQTIIKQ